MMDLKATIKRSFGIPMAAVFEREKINTYNK
jgi:hypothetical protein